MYTYYFEVRRRLVTHHQLWKIVNNTSIWKVGNFLCLQYIVHLLYFISIYITTINATLQNKIPTHRRMRNHKLRVSCTLRYRFRHISNGLLNTIFVHYSIKCKLNRCQIFLSIGKLHTRIINRKSSFWIFNIGSIFLS